MLTLLLSSCLLGPNYKRPAPPAPIPAKFKETPKHWKVANPNDGFNRGEWWVIFKDPKLNSLEERLNIDNQNILVAAAQYEQAKALVDEATAGFWPTASFSASITRSKQSTAGANSATASASTSTATPTSAATTTTLGSRQGGVSTTHSTLLNVSWVPDFWGIVRRTVEANKASAQSFDALLASARLTAQASLATYYFQLRGLDKDQVLLNDTVASDKHILQIVKHQYASGTAARADVVQAQSNLESAKALAINNGVNRAIYEHAIAVLVGRPASSFSISPNPYLVNVPRLPILVPSELLERRPDIASSERLVAQANAQIGVAMGAYYPNITLSGSASVQHSGLEDWFSYPLLNWAIGPSLTETIFDGGLRAAQVRYAKANYQATVFTYRQTVLAAFQNVEDNLATLRILKEQQAADDRAAADARLALKLVLNQYRSGTVPFSSVLTAETAVYTAELNAANVKYQRLTAAVGLILALGGGWNAYAMQNTCQYNSCYTSIDINKNIDK